ncbi:hypothetical protein MRX96_001966 [Rhipicephalus microplus]
MQLDMPATDRLDYEITAITDEFLDDEFEDPSDDEFEALHTPDDSSDDATDDELVEDNPKLPPTTASSAEIEKLPELLPYDWDPLLLEY